jgi:hypothetical protein
MSDENEWRNLMQGVSMAVKELEEGVNSMDRAVLECDRFILRAQRGLVSQDVLDGLRIGLDFTSGVEWLRGAPAQIAGLLEQLARHDDKVSDGELPATAHSWRYQIRERLARSSIR